MKRIIACIALFILSACGDAGTSPNQSAFPDVGGAYNISGTFNGSANAFSATTYQGTIFLNQVSRDQPTLDGNCAVMVQTTTGPIRFVGISAASVSKAGVVAFNIGQATGTPTWHFAGVASGGTITGTYTLTGSTGSIAGSFTATKQ